MRKFKYIGHTADIGLEAYGRNLAEAYANAACGLFSIITDLRKVRCKESRTLIIRETGFESLLFEWLNSLIYIFEVEKMLIRKNAVFELDDQHLCAVCEGEKIDRNRHLLKTGVKAATYHLLTVDRLNHRVKVILDV